MQQTEHVFNGTELLPIWDALEQWEAKMEEADRWYATSVDLTDRRFDSASRAGQRLYITASALIHVAGEHQYVLAKTMTGPDALGVYPHATPNLIRPAFEAALTAFWLLDGKDSQTRALRGLRQSWEDHRQSDAWADDLLHSPLATKEEREEVMGKKAKIAKRYHEDADDLGVKWEKVRQKVNLWDEVKNLSTVQGDPLLRQAIRATWRQLSGVQHGLQYASLRSGQRIGEVPIPGGAQAMMVTDDDWLMTACRASATVQAWAMSSYINRTRGLAR